jgi:carnitine O-palmitoyltransferase 1
MAEARLGVHPMPGLQRAGFEVDTSVKACQVYVGKQGLVVYVPHPKFWLRGVRRWFWKALNKTRVAFMPIPLWAIAGGTLGFVTGVLKAERTSWLRSGALAERLWAIDSKNPFVARVNPPVWFRVAYLAAGSSITAMLAFAATQRFVLRRLLSYHGWLDRRNLGSVKVKLWGLAMKKIFLSRISHQLYAYQWCLPYLPLPNAKATCEKFIRTITPLLEEAELEKVRADAVAFLRDEAPALQRRLRLKWALSPNYVSDWWLDFVYLRSRESLPINSNWYGITFAEYEPTKSQAARAAVCTFLMVRTKIAIDKETLDPHVIANVAPLCMAQYEHAFSSTRVPGYEQDRLEKYDSHESRHVVVISRGKLYMLPVFSPNTMAQLTPLQLFNAYQGILQSTTEASDGEALLPALTTMNRTEWANIREEFFERDPHNASRLEVIESALFVVCLDDEAPEPMNWSQEGRQYMCGNCHNRWSDKSFNLVITKNAKAGVHAEHAWGDAPALAHILEIMMLSEKAKEFYSEDGAVKNTPIDDAKIKAGKFITYPAERIDMRIGHRLHDHAKRAYAEFREKADDFDLYVNIFESFGKKLMGKQAKVSPDAFIQMALQLAYFRDQGRFDLTYESSMTRLFRNGRTETIRTVSQESCDFVRALENKTKSKKELLTMLRAACDQHQRYTMETMIGEGVDRHLFSMFVVSVGISKPSAFLRSALGRKWTLSTSQVPPMQCGEEAHAKAGSFHTYSPNGGFGPVADNGYGVCYSVWDDRLYFNVSAKVSAKNTSARRFHGRICQALKDIAALAQE